MEHTLHSSMNEDQKLNLAIAIAYTSQQGFSHWVHAPTTLNNIHLSLQTESAVVYFPSFHNRYKYNTNLIKFEFSNYIRSFEKKLTCWTFTSWHVWFYLHWKFASMQKTVRPRLSGHVVTGTYPDIKAIWPDMGVMLEHNKFSRVYK